MTLRLWLLNMRVMVFVCVHGMQHAYMCSFAIVKCKQCLSALSDERKIKIASESFGITQLVC